MADVEAQSTRVDVQNEQLVLEQSPQWEALKHSSGFIETGFPFNEGFPNIGPYDNRRFTILVRQGLFLPATVDFTRQYEAEGTHWLLEVQAQDFGRRVTQHMVAAWCEVPLE